MASAGGAFGGSRGLQPLPPEKGVFPLDHFGECKQIMTEYVKCLKENGNKGEKCRDITKSYLECRMDRNLMAKQELRELGFSGKNEPPGPRVAESPKSTTVPQSQKSATGYVAGLPSNNPAK